MRNGTGRAVPGRSADGACAEMLQTRPLRQSVCWNGSQGSHVSAVLSLQPRVFVSFKLFISNWQIEGN